MSLASTVLADGAVGLWELAEPSGTTTTDQAGISNGTYSGTVTLGAVGLPGGGGATAAQQTATSGKSVVPVVAGNTLIDTFTLELWVLSAGNPAASRGLLGSGPSTILRVNTDGTFKLTKAAVQDIYQSTTPIPVDSAFHHVVATKSGAAVHLYRDAVDVSGTITNTAMATNAGSNINLMGNGTDNALVGTFAFMAVYPLVLSPAQVSAHFSLGASSGLGGGLRTELGVGV
jgi:Concanavalin A-like lectin/glucanases superfamily